MLEYGSKVISRMVNVYGYGYMDNGVMRMDIWIKQICVDIYGYMRYMRIFVTFGFATASFH